MTAKLKLAAYVVLIVLAIWFGHEFHSSYSQIGQTPANPATNVAPSPSKAQVVHQPEPAPATNASTNSGITNLASVSTDSNGSNAVAPVPPPTNVTAITVTPATPTATAAMLSPNSTQGGRSIGYLAAFVATMIGLGVLIAYDLTQFLGTRAVDYLFNDEGEGMRDPEYERAEQTWVNGKPLEAIEMMREYLKKNPRAQYAALRIAEIYEKDLRNYVAASLEYEEVLKKRLPDERWGWAAIHLCNIYSRMGKQDKMKALLERIARDYPKTGAAKKARRNLGLPEPVEDEEEKEATPAPAPKAAAEADSHDPGHVFDLDEVIATPDEAPAPEAAPEPPAAPESSEPPKPNLPPGFRKKK